MASTPSETFNSVERLATLSVPQEPVKEAIFKFSATNLDVTNGAQIDGSIFGGGEGGDILLNISETARFDGVSPLLNRFASGVYSRNQGGNGVGGDVRIGANNLHVTNGALIDASSFGIGDGGNIFLRVYDRARFSGKRADY